MLKIYSDNPRSIRARHAFQQALKALLKTKPYTKISITDIAIQAGFARHTFYNHYETKDDLLYDIIDSVLDEFFSIEKRLNIGWNTSTNDDTLYSQIGITFFKIWQENIEIVRLLNTVNVDHLLISRLRDGFTSFFYDYLELKTPGLKPALAEYFITINAHVFAGILMQWFKDDLRYPPEVIGELLNHFVGLPVKQEATKKFGEIIK